MNETKDSLIEKLLRILILIVVILAFTIPFTMPRVFAATDVTLTGGDNVKGGQTFIVTVDFTGDDVGRVDAQLIYDTDMLTYISGGSSSGNTGYIQLKTAGTSGNISFDLEFQALSEGSTSLELTTNEMYDVNEMLIDGPSANKTITIDGNVKDDERITEPIDPQQPEDTNKLETGGAKPLDEKVEQEKPSMDKAQMLIITVAVLVLLIIIVVVILARKKKPAPKPVKGRIGRSGMPLDPQDDEDEYIDIDKW